MIDIDDPFLFAESVLGVVVWAALYWRTRQAQFRNPFASLALGMLVWSSILTGLVRSVMGGDESTGFAGFTYGIYLVVGLAFLLTWRPPNGVD